MPIRSELYIFGAMSLENAARAPVDFGGQVSTTHRSFAYCRKQLHIANVRVCRLRVERLSPDAHPYIHYMVVRREYYIRYRHI